MNLPERRTDTTNLHVSNLSVSVRLGHHLPELRDLTAPLATGETLRTRGLSDCKTTQNEKTERLAPLSGDEVTLWSGGFHFKKPLC